MEPRYDLAMAGGAYVRRRFVIGGKEVQIGDVLSVETLASIPRLNRRALVNTGRIELFPRSPGASTSQPELAGAEMHLVHLGGGKYHVVRGVRVTDAPVSREEAEEIATRPENAAQ